MTSSEAVYTCWQFSWKWGLFSKKDFTQQRPASPISVENGRQLGKELLESSSGLQRMLQTLQAFLGRCQSTRWCPVHLINLHAGFHDAEGCVQAFYTHGNLLCMEDSLLSFHYWPWQERAILHSIRTQVLWGTHILCGFLENSNHHLYAENPCCLENFSKQEEDEIESSVGRWTSYSLNIQGKEQVSSLGIPSMNTTEVTSTLTEAQASFLYFWY